MATAGPFKGFAYIVDCTEHELSRPNEKADELSIYSGKAGFPAIKYEGTIKHCIFYHLKEFS